MKTEQSCVGGSLLSFEREKGGCREERGGVGCLLALLSNINTHSLGLQAYSLQHLLQNLLRKEKKIPLSHSPTLFYLLLARFVEIFNRFPFSDSHEDSDTSSPSACLKTHFSSVICATLFSFNFSFLFFLFSFLLPSFLSFLLWIFFKKFHFPFLHCESSSLYLSLFLFLSLALCFFV